MKLGASKPDGSEDHMIKFDNAKMVLNPVLPWYHYIIADKSDITLLLLINALKPDVILPKYLSTSIFPNGLQLTVTGNEDGEYFYSVINNTGNLIPYTTCLHLHF